jgi:acetyl esterase/lipase
VASEQAEGLKQMYRQMREAVLDGPVTLEEQRAQAEMFGTGTAEPHGVRYEPVDAGGVPAEWVIPDGADESRVIQYLHGGGYVLCSMKTHSRFVGHLAKATGCRALNVDYRLAPEHPHPAAVTDSVTAYRWLLDQGISPSHLAVSGDSAGGGLTMATVLKIRDEGLALPAAAVPMSPWVDLDGTGDSMTTRADVDLLVSDVGLKEMASMFIGDGDSRDPYASPLQADLTGLPPIYIQVGDEETLLDDSVRLAAKAEAAGVDVRLDVFPEMQHVFQIMAGNMPESDEAIARIAEWLRPRLGLG